MRLGIFASLLLSTAAFAQLNAPGAFVPNQYVLILEDPPVAQRFAARDQLRTPAADSYRQQVEAKHAALRSELAGRNITVTGSVSTVLNAMFVIATPDRVDEMKALPGVVGVRPLRRGKRNLNKATALMNAPAAWALPAIGGQQNAGKGMKIAILDTGIDQTHPAFANSGLSIPSGFPKCNAPSDCINFTNSKVIVARSYVPMMAAGSNPTNPAADSTPDDFSALDHDGHGTAVASAAAAGSNTGAVTFTGMAPQAYLGSYKVYGSPGVNDYPPESVWIQAIEDAVNDGMDVAVFSSGIPALSGPLDTGTSCGLTGTAACDPLAAAFEAAAKTMVISVSAGNDGENGAQYPNYNSIESPAFAPSVMAVGATLNSHVMMPSVSIAAANAPSSLKNIFAQLSDANSSLEYASVGNAQSAPLIDVTTLGDNGLACSALPANSLVNSFALIERGTCNFSVKAANAQNAGAVGVVMYMADSSALLTPEGVDQFVGPLVMVANSDGNALKSYLESNPGAVTTIDLAGTDQDLGTFNQTFQLSPAPAANQLASYSSVGPATGSYAVKPDLVAVGGFDVYLSPDPSDTDVNGFPLFAPPPGMYLAAESVDPDGELYSPNRYAGANGTSFSAPLAGGAAALVKQAHPTYTAAQIRSALVNNAAQSVTVDDFGDTVDIRSTGAGLLDAAAGGSDTLTAEPASITFGVLASGTALPSAASLTITNHSSSSLTLAVAVAPAVSAPGISLTPSSQSLALAGGAAGTLSFALSGTVPAAGAYSGLVTLTGSGTTLRIPYQFLVGSGNAYNLGLLLGSTDGIVGQELAPFAISITDENGVAVPNSSVSFSVTPRGSMTLQSCPVAECGNEPACTVNSTGAATCPTDSYGIAYVDVLLGPSPGSPTLNIRAAGQSFPISVTARQQPTISSGGVLAAANVDPGTPVAPGSYIAIYGSGLSDYTDVNSYTTLPLSLDYVTVSFDVPSAKLSVPGRIVFVSPNQVNVQVPWELQGQSSAQVKVTMNEYEFGNVVTVPLSDSAPAFFHAAADALDSNYHVITAGNPAARGALVQLYMNGLGPVNNQPASGAPASATQLATTKSQPVVTIGGQTAQVQFSGLAPGFPGLYQINFTVPQSVTPGASVPITVAIGGQTSKAATIPVQ